ncbi:hypothetical protein CBR_g28535 [Chara braunii]|uniref:ABC transporter domain-containing protein n=1 Tax=Chara braunii TaxID=69332 RepID=A0A388JWB5_CHABU|nr:hypothetical protein CBR_g28535 [Chara braunii]|eukprot:GBG62058.1 hypothetical protein CBR_g28535 [Chara braunii]
MGDPRGQGTAMVGDEELRTKTMTRSSPTAVREPTVAVNNLSFTYPGLDGQPPPGARPMIEGFNLTLHAGDRCLLAGANGAGKTTLLKVLGGKHLVDPTVVRVLGRSAFHDTTLVATGELSYLGGEWRRDVAFYGFDVPLLADVSAEKMIFGVQGIDPERRRRLIQVLDVDLNWRMHKVSDGQRRRVQICMGLLRPFKVLLLDEITVDLDVLGRADLMQFLKSECEERGATIIYATHIFDGLENWFSHIAYVADGRLKLAKPRSEIAELKHMSLMRTIELWLRADVEQQRKARKERRARGEKGNPFESVVVQNNGWAAGRMSSTLKGSSNSVLRL